MYEISAVGLDQLKRTLRGAEQEIVASSRRMSRAAGHSPGLAKASPAAATAGALGEQKRSGNAILKQREKELREENRIKNAANNLEIRAWQTKEREKTRHATQESNKRKRHADNEVRTLRRTQASMGRGVVNSVGRNSRNLVGMGAGILGIGGGLVAADAIQSTIGNQATSIDIVNASSVNKRGRTAEAVQDEAGKMALGAKVRSSEVLDAIQKFQAPTGDLDAAMSNMPELIKLSRATGTALGDMAEAAGRVMAADEDMKPENLLLTMRTIAGQGKKGAVEVRELAGAMAKLTGAAGIIGGDKGTAIAQLGAMAQMAVGKGGAERGEDSGTAVARFVQQAKGMKNLGGVKMEDADGMLRAPRDIIEELVDKSHGGRKFDVEQFGLEGNKAIRGYVATYNQANGTHEDKMKAVRGAFDNMLGPGAIMSQGQVNAANAKRMAATDAQITEATEKFHQAIGTQLIPVVTELVPEIVKLIPMVTSAAKGFAWLVKTLVDSPITTIGTILTGLVVKDVVMAKIGEKVAGAIAGQVSGGGGGGLGGVKVGKGNWGTALSAGLAAGAAGMAVGSGIANGVIDPLIEGSGAGERSGALMSSNLDSVTKALGSGKMSKSQAQKFLDDAKSTKQNAELNSGIGSYASALFGGGSLKAVSQSGAIAGDEGFAKAIAALEQAVNAAKPDAATMQASTQQTKATQDLTLAMQDMTNAMRGNGGANNSNRGGAPLIKR